MARCPYRGICRKYRKDSKLCNTQRFTECPVYAQHLEREARRHPPTSKTL